MKCIRSLQEKEQGDRVDVRRTVRCAQIPANGNYIKSNLLFYSSPHLPRFNCFFFTFHLQTPYDVVLLGGVSGRLDQTVHTLSYLHKLRKSGRRMFVVSDENVAWVLDQVGVFFLMLFPFLGPDCSPHTLRVQGKHRISIDHSILGPTCGLLPVGVDSAVLTTTGLRWNLSAYGHPT
jgi:thiamine pyrophosphokinase